MTDKTTGSMTFLVQFQEQTLTMSVGSGLLVDDDGGGGDLNVVFYTNIQTKNTLTLWSN